MSRLSAEMKTPLPRKYLGALNSLIPLSQIVLFDIYVTLRPDGTITTADLPSGM